MRLPRWLFAVPVLALFPGSTCLFSKLDGAACPQDSARPSPKPCLFDFPRSDSFCASRCAISDGGVDTACLTRCEHEKGAVNAITAYCTDRCVRDSDCPPDRFCSMGVDTQTSSSAATNLCVDKVR